MDEKVGQNPSDYGNGNSSSSTRRFKLIGFFVNNRSSHSEQLIIAIEMI